MATGQGNPDTTEPAAVPQDNAALADATVQGVTLEPDLTKSFVWTNVDDNDSAYGDNASIDSASLTSSILNHTYENGRRYHAFHQGEYPLPNDDKEQDRLDLLHHIWKLLLGGGLYVAPIPPNPQRVLDFGTGTGIWAIDFADEFPSAKVIGTDLSPMQPWWVPPNCTFYVDDSDNEWTFQPDEAFDYIHGRAMGGSIKDWDVLYREIYKHLKPGGYVEIQEYETWIQQNDETKETPQYLMKWQAGVNEAASKFGKPMFVARDHKKNMIAAGFVDVEDIAHKVPVGGWPKDKKAKEIGRYEQLHMIDAIEPFSLALFTRILGWSTEEVKVLAAHVRSDFLDPTNHLFSYFHFVYGRKPETETS